MRCRHMKTNTFAKGLSLDCLTNPCGDCILPVPEPEPCPWDDCIYPTCNSAMGCQDDAHTTPLRKP